MYPRPIISTLQSPRVTQPDGAWTFWVGVPGRFAADREVAGERIPLTVQRGVDRTQEPTCWSDRSSRGSPSPGWLGQAGFALPVVLLLVALLTALLTVGLTRAANDVQIAVASQAVDEAIVVARSGLQTYFGSVTLSGCGRALRPSDGDSVRINVTGGYADVVARVVLRPADSLANWLYVVRSTGRVIWPAMGATPVGNRTVAQFAEWQSGVLALPAAFTAVNGLNRTPGGSGQLHGADEHGTSGCPTAPRRSLRVPAGVPDLTSYDLTGNPALGGGAPADIVTAARIDWAAVVTPGRIAPDFTSPRPDDGTYPIQFVTGNGTLGSAGATTFGRGLLIVTGDLTVLGSFVQWYGVVLVGGTIRFDAADQRFDGLVASGLNRQLGLAPPVGTIGGDYTDIDYNSMYVYLAMRPLTGFAPVANAYTEHWSTY